MMSSIIGDILPSSYFSADSLIGVQADQRVLCQLVSIFLPRLDATLQKHDIGKTFRFTRTELILNNSIYLRVVLAWTYGLI